MRDNVEPPRRGPEHFLEQARTFLGQARIVSGQNRFATGSFARGITLYRQQVRALNLIYSMVESGAAGDTPIPPRSTVVIVGGGVFGVTAAAAVAHAGYQVILLERHQELLHLQRGCDTRWIHPLSYDWPEAAAEGRLARLPFLNWAAAKAGDVAAEICRQYREIEGAGRFRLRTICEVSSHEVSPSGDKLLVKFVTNSEREEREVHAVIYAVGFGRERVKDAGYWRNDQLAQGCEAAGDGGKARFVVSGVGDGGLVDVFRLVIRDFRHDRIFHETFEASDPERALRDRLRQIAGERRTVEEVPASWLHDRFQSIKDDTGHAGRALKISLEKMRSRVRSDTAVWLSGRKLDFRQCLDLHHVSLGNALLAYSLNCIKAVEYLHNAVDDHGHLVTTLPSVAGAHVIVRHGIERKAAYEGLGLGPDAIHTLIEHGRSDEGVSIYPPGWWGKFTSSEPNDANVPPPRIEYVPPPLVAHATTFASTLASVLGTSMEGGAEGGRRFRVALHRLVTFEDDDVFQQVTQYFGNVEQREGVGRLFGVSGGIVGLASRIGRFVIVKRDDEGKFEEIWRKTALTGSGVKPVKQHVKSLLAYPFLAPPRSETKRRGLLVLFVDSQDVAFFNPQVTEMIAAACRGFVDLLESLLAAGALRQVGDGADGLEIEPEEKNETLIEELKALGVVFPDGDGTTVSFHSLRCLELELGQSSTHSVRLSLPVAGGPPPSAGIAGEASAPGPGSQVAMPQPDGEAPA